MIILGEEDVTRTTYTATRSATTGRTSIAVASTTTIRASVQPAGADDLATLPEGERTRKARRFYTETALSATSPADRIAVGGETFEIRSVERERSVLAHYKAIGVRVDEVTT